MPNTDHDEIHVAVGVVSSGDQYLIARRPKHIHQGGKWEFPGGKVEPAETVEQALCRELYEELGIRPSSIEPLMRVNHRYAEKSVLLDVWRVVEFAGTPSGREGQEIRWVLREELPGFDFPAANANIVDAIIGC